MKIPGRFSTFINECTKFARSIYRNPKALKRFLGTVNEYARKNKKHAARFWDDLITLYELLRAWMMGEYPHVPTDLIIWIIVALAYFLLPIDLIPDFIPGGFIDDGMVFAFVLNKFKGEIDRFRVWQNRKKLKPQKKKPKRKSKKGAIRKRAQ